MSLDGFERVVALFILLVLMMSGGFIGGYYYNNGHGEVVINPDVGFTLDRVDSSDHQDSDSVVYRTRTDTAYIYDTVKVYNDYFRTRTYDLQFADHDIDGSATVSENKLEDLTISEVSVNRKPFSLGVNVNAGFQLSPNVNYTINGTHEIGTTYQRAMPSLLTLTGSISVFRR